MPVLPILFALAALGPSACGSHGSTPPLGSIGITVRSLVTDPISSVRVTVQSPTVLATPIKLPVAFKSNQSSVLLRGLPAANDYLVTADALDGSYVILAHGMAGGVSVVKGQTTKVIVYLNEVIVPPPFSNAAPVIDAITMSADAVAPGGQIALAGMAHDPDPGQTATLAFSWLVAASCGTISNLSNVPGSDLLHPSESRATWNAPLVAGSCQITFTAKDVLGLSTSATFLVRVGASNTGPADVSVVFNDAPVIAAITSAPAQLSSTGPTEGVLEVLATDPEDDALSYAWSTDPGAPCTVDFDSPDAVSTAFTATPTAADAAFCTFVVLVSDGTWPGGSVTKNTSVADLTLAMTAEVAALAPPVFGVAYQSYDSATSGVEVLFGAIAIDPEGGTLAYDWSASAGSPPQAAEPAALGLDPAFSTAATWTAPAGAESLISDLQITVTATSSATNLQSALTFSLKPANAP